MERARRLPRCVADLHFGFEFRLGASSPAADLFVVVLPDSELAHHYVREGASSACRARRAIQHFGERRLRLERGARLRQHLRAR